MELLETLKTLITDLRRGLELYPENFDIPKTTKRINELQTQINYLTQRENVWYHGNTNLH